MYWPYFEAHKLVGGLRNNRWTGIFLFFDLCQTAIVVCYSLNQKDQKDVTVRQRSVQCQIILYPYGEVFDQTVLMNMLLSTLCDNVNFVRYRLIFI